MLLSGLRELDLTCSRFRDDSELQRLNRQTGRPVPVSSLLRDALEAALAAARMTEGLVDPTVGNAMTLIGYDRTFSRVVLRERALAMPTFAPAGR
jgi:thiamine biosynthesis lipoprotein